MIDPKSCINCKFHHVENRVTRSAMEVDVPMCLRPKVDLVMGGFKMESYYEQFSCFDERTIEGTYFKCGPEAKFFTPKEAVGRKP